MKCDESFNADGRTAVRVYVKPKVLGRFNVDRKLEITKSGVKPSLAPLDKFGALIWLVSMRVGANRPR